MAEGSSTVHVILMGAQGSGKGTQAGRLGPELGLVKVATGDLFRAAIAGESELGKQVKAIYDRGDLIPDEITVGLVEEQLDEIAEQRAVSNVVKGALFDGFPRNLSQAKALDDALARRGERLTAVVEIVVPKETLVVRLAGRRVCTVCGAVYHIEFNPPQQDRVCDRCGGEVIQREDDQPGPIKRRLDLYFEQTEPVLSYYRERGLLEQVNGDRPIEVVTAAIGQAIERKGANQGS